jgi:hypothetical protein
MHQHRRRAARIRHTACVALCLISAACHQAAVDRRGTSAIVGTWLVTIPEAPFPLHMFVFHSDGTVLQSNPDAGDPNTSDSNLMGAWRAERDGFKGRLVEVTADRTTRQFVSRGEISFSLKVDGNAITGTASALFYDASGRPVRGPVAVTLQGRRILP